MRGAILFACAFGFQIEPRTRTRVGRVIHNRSTWDGGPVCITDITKQAEEAELMLREAPCNSVIGACWAIGAVWAKSYPQECTQAPPEVATGRRNKTPIYASMSTALATLRRTDVHCGAYEFYTEDRERRPASESCPQAFRLGGVQKREEPAAHDLHSLNDPRSDARRE